MRGPSWFNIRLNNVLDPHPAPKTYFRNPFWPHASPEMCLNASQCHRQSRHAVAQSASRVNLLHTTELISTSRLSPSCPAVKAHGLLHFAVPPHAIATMIRSQNGPTSKLSPHVQGLTISWCGVGIMIELDSYPMLAELDHVVSAWWIWCTTIYTIFCINTHVTIAFSLRIAAASWQ